jgi:hypothetical protein
MRRSAIQKCFDLRVFDHHVVDDLEDFSPPGMRKRLVTTQAWSRRSMRPGKTASLHGAPAASISITLQLPSEARS